jgi:hypothetical protein
MCNFHFAFDALIGFYRLVLTLLSRSKGKTMGDMLYVLAILNLDLFQHFKRGLHF